MASINVPNSYVQDSIKEVLDDLKAGKIEGEDVWISVEGQEIVLRANRSLKLESFDSHYTALISPQNLKLDLYHDGSHLCTVRLGENVCSLKEFGRLSCGDVLDGQAIIGTQSGKAHLLNVSKSEDESEGLVPLSTELGDHLSYTSVVRFFPSGKVALSAGIDRRIKIWDLATGNEVQTLSHQKETVYDVCMIGRGRNLLSFCRSSSDSVVLWEVGSAKVVHKYDIPRAQSIALWSTAQNKAVEANPYMYDCDDKLAIVGCEHSTLMMDLRASASETSEIVSEGSDHIQVVNNSLYRVSGPKVACNDLRMSNKPLYELHSASPVSQLVSTPSSVLFRNGLGSYSFDASLQKFELICSENFGIMVGVNEELWTLGSELRHFI